MPKRKKRIDPEDPTKELDKLLRKLVPEQGMVARRNARTAVCAELRRVRSFIDKEYPSLTPKKQRKKRTKQMGDGWEPIPIALRMNGGVAKLAAAKIKIKMHGDIPWVPRWVLEMLRHPRCSASMLKKAQRSVAYRKEVLMDERLKQSNGSNLRLVSNG